MLKGMKLEGNNCIKMTVMSCDLAFRAVKEWHVV